MLLQLVKKKDTRKDTIRLVRFQGREKCNTQIILHKINIIVKQINKKTFE
jgi:hypothetical protein